MRHRPGCVCVALKSARATAGHTQHHNYMGDSMTVWMIASILHTLTGYAWSVFTVHGIRAACEVTVSHGQAYANGCLR